MEKYKRLKDPIYGYISVPDEYMHCIVDTAVFQRLRRVIQTSYAPLYSSAVHNRFVHSLGVYYLGRIASKQLVEEICVYKLFDRRQVESLQKIFLLACLLHDVGHAPFSHTGEAMYLDLEGEKENCYIKIHEELKQIVDSEEFSQDVPELAAHSAAPHEIMSVIVGIQEFRQYFENAEERSFFARCILGYEYTGRNRLLNLKNCFISLLNSKVIDVDKLDYLIRDAYITGFHTVNIDYQRLLTSITVIVEDDNESIQLAYRKNAISVIENVVYAHDAEKKWIQTHPVVVYETYLLEHIFQYLHEKLDRDEHKLFSYQSLTREGQELCGKVRVSLLCDDDIIYFMKNMFPSKLGNEFFERRLRRHPVWKSESEYAALFAGIIGENSDSMTAFEEAMSVTVSYLKRNADDSWTIDESVLEKVKKELEKLDSSGLKSENIAAQRKDKEKIIKLMDCLIKYARENDLEPDFVLLGANQFISSFGKPDFSNMPIVFEISEEDYIDRAFAKIANPLQSERLEEKKFYYLFYRRQDKGNSFFDKKKLCEYLGKEFTRLKTHSRRKKDGDAFEKDCQKTNPLS